jgi:hypothetical protein
VHAKHTAHFAATASGTKTHNRTDDKVNSKAQLLAEWVCHEEGIVSLQVQHNNTCIIYIYIYYIYI